MTPAKRPIAVIGAGYSGTIATLHLLRRLAADQPVLMCDRKRADAAVVAAASGTADHVLNVRATNMSALADEPTHFSDWVRQTGPDVAVGLVETDAGQFPTRGLYAQYLRSTLEGAAREAGPREAGPREVGGRAPLAAMTDELVDIKAAGQGGFELVRAEGEPIPVAGVVFAQADLPPEEHSDPRICASPWSDKTWRKLDDDLPVLIVGTNLTMVDLAVSLRRAGYAGEILAISSRGLLPARHAPVPQWPTPQFTLAEETSLSLLMLRLREDVLTAADKNVDWRAVIDSMRPVTAQLWSRLPLAERQRFLRHARRYWDVHRHRMAPPNADQIDTMLQTGGLRVLSGRLTTLAGRSDSVRVRYLPRGGGREKDLRVQRVIYASGVEQFGRTRDKLMQGLLDRGTIRLDAQGLGLDVTDGLNVVRDDGTPADMIWALGPIVRGVFWECTAVPDIRVQAGHVAVSVVARLREQAPRRSLLG
jgi:uncharacterized NAD(P)/FAD-binding protein YdhS